MVVSITVRLSLTGKRWRMRSGANTDDTAAEFPADVLRRLIAERMISDDHGAPPPVEPHSLPDGQRAADRLRQALRGGERIGVIGDYDCDGITSAAQLIRMLRRHQHDPVVHLPHRVHDGYELKPAQADYFAEAGVTLLLIADNGITAVPMIARAAERGIDVIVLDHHSVAPELPAAYALVHPALGNLPQPHPSAAGVVFSFLHLVETAPWEGYDDDLALAAMGTVADLVPLTGGNRRLVKAGLSAMARLTHGPVYAMINDATGSPAPTASDIAFRIAPRINAAGRMDDPMIALDALLDGGEALAAINACNAQRQELQRSLSEDVMVIAKQQEQRACICVAGSYPHGIIGLLAGRMTELTGKPSIACAVDGAVATGSLRSPPGISIIDVMRAAAAALGERGAHVRFGGHAQAAGCTLPADLLGEYHQALCREVAQRTTPEDLLPAALADAVLDARHISMDLPSQLALLEPFGQGNPEPRFILRNVLVDSIRRAGAEGRHLQARIAGQKAIGFGLGHLAQEIAGPADILCRIGLDTWNGRRSVQLFIEDLQVSAVLSNPEKLSEGVGLAGPAPAGLH